MTLRSLLTYAHEDDEIRSLATAVASAPAAEGAPSAFFSAALRPFLLAALLDTDGGGAGGCALLVVGDDRAARDLTIDLRTYLSPRPVRFYPARGVRYESHLMPPPHLVGLRVGALDALLSWDGSGDAPVVVISAAALAEKVPDPTLRPHGFALKVGEEIDLSKTVDHLVECGYDRTDQVEERGQFAVRGDILDLFPATEERAVRCELFGDEVERLAWFSTFTQRSLGEVGRVNVDPAAELGLAYRQPAEQAAAERPGDRPDIAELFPVDRFVGLTSLLQEETVVILVAEDELSPALTDLWQDVTVSMHADDAHQLYVEPDAVRDALGKRAALSVSVQSRDQAFQFRAQAADFAARNLRDAEGELQKLVRSGYRTVVTWRHRGEAERARYNLPELRPEFLEGPDPPSSPGVFFAEAPLGEGFIWPHLKLAVVPQGRLLRRRRVPAAEGVERRRAFKSFAELTAGDYVVHSDHGVARFAGFETRTVAGVTRDYMYLEFRDEDKVYVPADQLDKVSPYIGANGSAPRLSKLGGTRWQSMKARARRAARDLAGDLISLYAERRRRRGHTFPPDSDWQLEFERAFPYRETHDQLEAIEQVKADMEEPRPMDRLICGDVGYGKTEVALRAAFKSSTDGKQVMLLVPTTILAQQHLGTFSERLGDFPLRVEMVSRLRSAKQNRATLADFQAGKVDILIGTHRLFSRDVMPDDLGLLIVDEEQRFGVKQKELLTMLRLRVDVISLSATPIPRTLQMSLAGLRDIAVIEEPPEGRRPIRTYVGEYDEQLIKQAIEREVTRGGQAFYLHNRVETIEEVAEYLRSLCPGIRFSVAHGQLRDRKLERTMLSFLRGDSDCLVCTSIVESGLDIPQANTLIVERADLLGLAQLYQIRGRVGRSPKTAYAYLLYPSAETLSQEAAARLATLSDHTELGSGFKIAMRDLELRGAGNLLGEEQTGHVAAVGFELYCEMLDQAVAALQAAEQGRAVDGRPPPEEAGMVRLDIAVDAYIPRDYVPYEVAKIDLHRRIAATGDLADLASLREEIEDRFGSPPDPVVNLTGLAEARIKLGRAGVRAASYKRGRLTATPVELRPHQFKELHLRIDSASYESATRSVTARVPDSTRDQLAALVGFADAILAARGA